MKFLFVLVSVVVLVPQHAQAAAAASFHCKANAQRVYHDTGAVKDSTGKEVGHTNQDSGVGSRVILIDGTNNVVERSLQDGDNGGKGVYLELKSAENSRVRRGNGSLTFDGGYEISVGASEIDSKNPLYFNVTLLTRKDGRITRFHNKQSARVSDGSLSIDVVNMDSENAWLSLGTTYFKDTGFNQLATLVKSGKIEEGTLVGASVQCEAASKK